MIRKNISLSDNEYQIIYDFAKKNGYSFSEILRKATLDYIHREEELDGLKFYQAFIEIAEERNNFTRYDIKKLRNQDDSYRMRIGKYRAIFRVVEKEIVIIVFDIDSRGGIYK